MENKKTKLIIVGSGPAGLTAAIYSSRAGLHPIVAAGSVSPQSIPGGQLMITTEVENFPGFPDGVQGPELMERMRAQAIKFGAIIIEEYATEFKFKNGGPHQVKIGKEWYESSAIILANGASAKWLGLEGEERLRNNGISACATCDGPLPIFRKKDIYVVGGGDSAIEEATFLSKFAKKVYLLVRGDKFRASKVMQDRAMENEKIQIMFNTKIRSYLGEDRLTGLILEDSKTGDIRQVEAAGVFMGIGHEPLTKELRDSGLDLDEAGYIKVTNHVYTNIKGVFAAGDVHDVHYRQAITAAGFGCMASITAERWLQDI
ncbi:ribonucleotide reductase large subunit [Orpheovirus IHUMI-LCC2]|uniref:Thioredoxin-disulfide reductase n=1 Tax=Orpheovirus IHUMI-LCC2 TaxID=2023057 RepID=A0A2I2L5E1_9VIRU|nr:ribonucleotide reductase large subunit [Orpheovirus IHUMI-LCC2]SNW62753.1 Thioredoxin-disulfide reductase [Orpheovirus IHUMI-LCC2]